MLDGCVDSGVDNCNIVGDFAAGVIARNGRNVSVTRTNVIRPFPADQLRAALAGRPQAIAAVNDIERELKSGNPVFGKVVAAVETVKAFAIDLPAVCQTIADWASHFLP